MSITPQRIIFFLSGSLSFTCQPFHGWAPISLAAYVMLFEGPDVISQQLQYGGCTNSLQMTLGRVEAAQGKKEGV